MTLRGHNVDPSTTLSANRMVPGDDERDNQAHRVPSSQGAAGFGKMLIKPNH